MKPRPFFYEKCGEKLSNYQFVRGKYVCPECARDIGTDTEITQRWLGRVLINAQIASTECLTDVTYGRMLPPI
jgi:hypothetical protein